MSARHILTSLVSCLPLVSEGSLDLLKGVDPHNSVRVKMMLLLEVLYCCYYRLLEFFVGAVQERSVPALVDVVQSPRELLNAPAMVTLVERIEWRNVLRPEAEVDVMGLDSRSGIGLRNDIAVASSGLHKAVNTRGVNVESYLPVFELSSDWYGIGSAVVATLVGRDTRRIGDTRRVVRVDPGLIMLIAWSPAR